MRTARSVLNDISDCTVQRPDGAPCGDPGAPDMPFPICGRHASILYRAVAKLMSDTVLGARPKP